MQLSDNKSEKENHNQAHMLHFLAGCSCIPPSSLPPTGSGLPGFHAPVQSAKQGSSQSCIWGGQAQSTLPALLGGVWGRGSWLLAPAAFCSFQSRTSASHLSLKVQKIVQASHLLLSLASAGKVSPLDKQSRCFGGVQRMATAWFLHWYVCSDAFQEEQVQDAEGSWQDFSSCISASVFQLGLTAQGQVLPPKISGRHQL